MAVKFGLLTINKYIANHLSEITGNFSSLKQHYKLKTINVISTKTPGNL